VAGTVILPDHLSSGGLSLVEAIDLRRSVRDLSPEPVLLFQLSQILWAAQGITSTKNNLRSVPSAGGTYPLEIYAIIGDDSLENVDPGVYHYDVVEHALSMHIEGDIRWQLSGAAMSQEAISVAPVSLVICAIYDRTLMRYSTRGERYVYLEAGHAGQNIYLQATALNLATVAIGAFRDDEVRKLLQLDSHVKPLYIFPIGKPG
jgi:SagB-type dehydrogenase family enzyme